MDRKEKLFTFKAFMDTTCRGCGGSKDRKYWFCYPCWEIISKTEHYETLKASCTAHTAAIQKNIMKVKELE